MDLPEEQREGLTLIGFDESESLELKRMELRVRVTKVAKYVEENNPQAGVLSPERPTGLVEGNRYGPCVAAEIIAAKYFYHLPLYRQQDLFASCGWTPSRSTLLNIMTAAEFALQPLALYYHNLIRGVSLLGCDDTTVNLIVPRQLPELDPMNPRSDSARAQLAAAIEAGKKNITARMWAYRGIELPINVYDFTVNRSREGPDLMLSNFQGTLLGDCWSGFQKIHLRSDARIERAACWAHARRKFWEIRHNFPLETSRVLGLIGQLFEIESRCQSLEPAERCRRRQQESSRVLESLRSYIDSDACASLLPKSGLGQAIGYLRNHWEALSVFLGNGLLPIDNNEVEQLMRQVALGRKNWLFIGSVEAGWRAANLMTIVSTAARKRPGRLGLPEGRVGADSVGIDGLGIDASGRLEAGAFGGGAELPSG